MMNRIYKILKTVFKNTSAYFCIFYLTFQPVLAQTVPNNTLPTNPNVTSGSATFNQTTNQLTINQATDKLITNWSSFNIGKDATVTFNQPSSLSSALNRVNSSDPSYIFGKLNANGQVILLNQSGVIFGNGAKFDAGSFIASTLNIKDTDFLNGRMVFEKDGVAGSITNEGFLNAFQGGAVALIAPQIINNGTITAEQGTAALLSGNKVTLSLNGNKLIKYTIDEGTLNSYIENNGAIKVDEGTIILSAKTLDELSKSVINNSGIIEAKGISTKGGKVLLEGDDITLKSTSVVDASGNLGGGEVLIGGDYQGKNPDIRNAKTILAEAGSVTKADAISEGDGGKIIFWSNVLNRFYGNIYARGGNLSGDGGFVEVSSKRKLDYTGVTNTLAPFGTTGMLLLDPVSYYIATTAASTTDADHSSISISTLGANLTTTNQTISATSDIYLANDFTWAGVGGSTQTRNLIFSAPLVVLGGSIAVNGSADDKINFTSGINSSSKLFVIGASRSISTNGGTITVNGNIGGAQDLTLNSGTGTTSIGQATGGLSGTYWSGTVTTTTTTVEAGSTIFTFDPDGNNDVVTIDFAAGTLTSTGTVRDVTSPLPSGITIGSSNTFIDLNAKNSTNITYKYEGDVGTSTVAVSSQGFTATANKKIIYLSFTVGNSSATNVKSSGSSTTTTTNSYDSSSINSNTLSSLSFSGSGTTTLNGSVTTTGAQSYTGAVSLGAASTLTTTNSDVTFSSTVNGAQNLTIAAGNGDTTFTGTVGGSTALTRLTITTDNLTAANIGLANSAALSVTNSGASSITGVISGTSATLTKAGAGTLTLSGTNTYTGATTISAGTLAVSGQLNSGNYSGNISNSGTLTYSSNSNQTLGGIISGTGALTKSGSGTLNLDGNNTYSGGTTISAGKVTASSTSSITSFGTGSITNNSGATLDYNNRALSNSVTNNGTEINKPASSSPTLTFASSTINSTTGSTLTNTLTKNSSGTASYESSNTSVATINSTTGAVTIVGAGTAVITVTVSAFGDYSLGTQTYTITATSASTSTTSKTQSNVTNSALNSSKTTTTGNKNTPNANSNPSTVGQTPQLIKTSGGNTGGGGANTGGSANTASGTGQGAGGPGNSTGPGQGAGQGLGPQGGGNQGGGGNNTQQANLPQGGNTGGNTGGGAGGGGGANTGGSANTASGTGQGAGGPGDGQGPGQGAGQGLGPQGGGNQGGSGGGGSGGGGSGGGGSGGGGSGGGTGGGTNTVTTGGNADTNTGGGTSIVQQNNTNIDTNNYIVIITNSAGNIFAQREGSAPSLITIETKIPGAQLVILKSNVAPIVEKGFEINFKGKEEVNLRPLDSIDQNYQALGDTIGKTNFQVLGANGNKLDFEATLKNGGFEIKPTTPQSAQYAEQFKNQTIAAGVLDIVQKLDLNVDQIKTVFIDLK